MKFAKSSFFACPHEDRTRSVGLGPTGMKPLRPLGGKGTETSGGKLHMQFIGNAGTGKTTMGRLIGDLLYRLHKTGFRSMFDISDSGRRNTVNLGAFGHICTLTLQWYKIRFYGPYQTNRLNLRYI